VYGAKTSEEFPEGIFDDDSILTWCRDSAIAFELEEVRNPEEHTTSRTAACGKRK
jgi:hypothetical protein